jgi:hypothetical protein
MIIKDIQTQQNWDVDLSTSESDVWVLPVMGGNNDIVLTTLIIIP